MLALKQALSLVSTNTLGGWQPSDETGLEAWYKNKEGITLNGSDVSAWADSSSNSYDMVQATATEQPAYNASTGALTFIAGDVTNLQSASSLALSDEFTIGIKLAPTVTGAVISSNTLGSEFFKIQSGTAFRIKIDGSQVDISLDSEHFIGDYYLVITRNASNLITLYFNGVAQADTETLAGTADIDAIGVRKADTNPFDGTIKEVQIYDSTNAALTANINTYLSTL